MATAIKNKNDEVNLRYWGDDGSYFQAWYPVCASDEISADHIIGKDFLNSRVIAYRNADGKAVVQTAYCPHLGADLSLGQIVDGEVRCPYHHWRFDSRGACSHVPSLGKGLRTASIKNYPLIERMGVVWIFNGDEGGDEIPDLIGVKEEDVLWRVIKVPVSDIECWIQLSNALDFQHLHAVHGLPANKAGTNIEFGPVSISFDIDIFYPTGAMKVYYHNTVCMRDQLPLPRGHYVLSGTNCLGPNRQDNYTVVAVDKPADESGMEEALKRLDDVAAFMDKLNDEDGPIVRTIRFRPKGEAKLVAADKWLGKMMDYYDNLPRGRPLD